MLTGRDPAAGSGRGSPSPAPARRRDRSARSSRSRRPSPSAAEGRPRSSGSRTHPPWPRRPAPGCCRSGPSRKHRSAAGRGGATGQGGRPRRRAARPRTVSSSAGSACTGAVGYRSAHRGLARLVPETPGHSRPSRERSAASQVRRSWRIRPIGPLMTRTRASRRTQPISTKSRTRACITST